MPALGSRELGAPRLGWPPRERYYQDIHDLNALQERLLAPFGTGAATYATAVFDEPGASAVTATPRPAPSSAVLIFDDNF